MNSRKRFRATEARERIPCTGIEFDRGGGVSTLPNNPEGGGHSLLRNIGGSKAGEDLRRDRLPRKNFLNRREKVRGSGLRLINGEKKGSVGGEERKAGEEERLELALDTKRAPATAVGKGGGI
jgi:hypothetical protein